MLKNTKIFILKILFALAGFTFTLNLHAQNFKDPMTGVTNRVYVQYTDSIVETFYYRGDKKIKTNDELFYYWYGAQDIKHTRGAFQGKLLHGMYTMFYYNKDLLAQGNFKYGLKDGEWKSWHQGGEIKSKERWKNGKIDGTAYYYGLNGKIQKVRKISGRFGNGYVLHYDKNGVLLSKEYYKNNSLEQTKTYQLNDKGKLIEVKPEKEKNTKKDKIKKNKKGIFKKKETADPSLKGEGKTKQKKTKSPKIKVHKFRQIVPGGVGA